MFKITTLIPVIIILLTAIVYYGFRKEQEYARLAAIPVLIIDLFSFPLGTLLSILFIGFLISPYAKFKPMVRQNLGYRAIGGMIFVFSIIGMLFVTGAMSGFIQGISVQTEENKNTFH